MTNKEKFLALVAEKDNSILEQIKNRIENRAWLKRSQTIALKVLMRIDELNITQKKLAEDMGVSAQLVNKWVRGKENLTLETISKFEKALDIQLIYVDDVTVIETFNNQLIEVIDYDEKPTIYSGIEELQVLSETKVIKLEAEFCTMDSQFNTAV